MSFKNTTLKHTLSDLHSWYRKNGRRDLPWRNTDNPYRIYLSEIMLQQTQVKTVLARYYFPFLERFPTFAAVAEAEREAVIKQWEGLGYYSRAGNLHKAARACTGILPETIEGLLALPGIGKNTAHAIACFAYHQPVAIMEANVKRVLCRVFALEKAEDKILWEKAELLLDRDNPFDYNQAMMDIGATVCTKRNPDCLICPLNTLCVGKISPDAYPAPKKSVATPTRQRIIIVLENAAGEYYMQKRETRLLQGLYGFPEYPADTVSITHHHQDYPLAPAAIIGNITQVYSHFTLEAMVYRVYVDTHHPGKDWVSLNTMRTLPLSRADHKVVAMLR